MQSLGTGRTCPRRQTTLPVSGAAIMLVNSSLVSPVSGQAVLQATGSCSNRQLLQATIDTSASPQDGSQWFYPQDWGSIDVPPGHAICRSEFLIEALAHFIP
jgi:hypothetical protein